jgi:hypothetical protein
MARRIARTEAPRAEASADPFSSLAAVGGDGRGGGEPADAAAGPAGLLLLGEGVAETPRPLTLSRALYLPGLLCALADGSEMVLARSSSNVVSASVLA